MLETGIEEVREARGRAYCPYSGFAVGAALRTKSGKIYTGCNVENISFGLTICAERVALFSAIVAGDKEFSTLYLLAKSNQPILPCGACRQVLSEFEPNLLICSLTEDGSKEEFLLSDLLPKPRQGILS